MNETIRAIDRRQALRLLTGAALLAGGKPLLAQSGQQPQGTVPAIPRWPAARQPRQIWLRRLETGESCIARYYDGQDFAFDQYLAACVVLRDLRSGTVAHISIELLDLVYAMQQWLVSWGVDQPLLVYSGYRTKATNERTEGAARNSLHMQGRAVDFSIRGISNEYLGRLAAILRAGGVGFYPGHGFVHGDIGPVRYWRS